MPNLLMITGLGSAFGLASGEKGAFYYTLEEFHKHWERIDIVAPRISGVPAGEKIIFDNVHVHISGLPLLLYPLYFIRKCLRLHKERKFDLMTVHEFPPFYNGIAAKLIRALTGLPYILEIHHIPGLPEAASFKESFYRILCSWFLGWDSRKARAVRVVNKNQTRLFLEKAGVPANKIKYIPSIYIDGDVYKQMPEIEKKFDVVCAGRLEKNKNIAGLIEAVAILKKNKLDVSLLVIGDGPEKQKLKLKAKNLKLENNVRFSGWLADALSVAVAMNQSRIFVNPSFNEGGPRVAVEAMACGLPVITTPVGLMLDIIRDGENGLFCGWDAESIASSIRRIFSDEELKKRCSHAGSAVIRQFEKKTVIKNYADRLKELI